MSEDRDDERDLTISRRLDAPCAAVWRAWTDPAMLVQWFCPKPWTTELRAFDPRPGGAFHVLMRGPDGETSDNPGLFTEVVPEQRLVFTSVLTAGWRPVGSPAMPMTAAVTMADDGAGTAYRIRVLHADRAGRDAHEAMGFFEGWGICVDQLEAVARQIAGS